MLDPKEGSSRCDYIISLKVVKTINSEWLELITIDSYRDN